MVMTTITAASYCLHSAQSFLMICIFHSFTSTIIIWSSVRLLFLKILSLFVQCVVLAKELAIITHIVHFWTTDQRVVSTKMRRVTVILLNLAHGHLLIKCVRHVQLETHADNFDLSWKHVYKVPASACSSSYNWSNWLCLTRNTFLIMMNRWCWLFVVNFKLPILFNKMLQNFHHYSD